MYANLANLSIKVRYKRGYRDQSLKQAIPVETLNAFRVQYDKKTDETSLTSQELESARHYK